MFGSILVLASSVARAASKYHLLLRDPHFSVIAVLVYRRPTIERRNVETSLRVISRIGRSSGSILALCGKGKRERLYGATAIYIGVIEHEYRSRRLFARSRSRGERERHRDSVATTLLHINGGRGKPCDRLGPSYVVLQKSFDRTPKILD